MTTYETEILVVALRLIAAASFVTATVMAWRATGTEAL
jgi:hypothetical protein